MNTTAKKTLPVIRWKTSADLANVLNQWLLEREIDLRLRPSEAEWQVMFPSTVAASPSEDREGLKALVTPFDVEVKVGDIRMMSPTLHEARPLLVAVFGDWDEGYVVVAPFSPYTLPATREELTLRPEAELTALSASVLELWNAHTVPVAALADSWRVDSMTNAEMKSAWDVFAFALTGKPLSSELECRCGASIKDASDPRIEYQREEAAVMHGIARRADELEQ